jgi:hypothetical protein
MAGKVYKAKFGKKTLLRKLYDKYYVVSWEEQRTVKLWHLFALAALILATGINF